MKPEAQRIAIAEACGLSGPFDTTSDWEEGPSNDGSGYDGFHDHLRAADGRLVPDYLTDLNAMHEAEKVLTPKQFHAYIIELRRFWSPDCLSIDALITATFEATCATAAQRSEAFLRTLNLWTP